VADVFRVASGIAVTGGGSSRLISPSSAEVTSLRDDPVEATKPDENESPDNP
jgi:hypothetical protein